MATPDFVKGNKAKVMIGTATVKGLNKITIPGIVRGTIKVEQFDQDIDFETTTSAAWEKGTIEGNYVPDDTTGQDALRAALVADDGIANIKLYDTETTYWAPDTATDANAKVFVTQIGSMDINKAGLVPFKAEFIVQGAFKRFTA